MIMQYKPQNDSPEKHPGTLNGRLNPPPFDVLRSPAGPRGSPKAPRGPPKILSKKREELSTTKETHQFTFSYKKALILKKTKGP